MVELLKRESICFHSQWKAQHSLLLFNEELKQCKSRLTLNDDFFLENDNTVRRVDQDSIPTLIACEEQSQRAYTASLEWARGSEFMAIDKTCPSCRLSRRPPHSLSRMAISRVLSASSTYSPRSVFSPAGTPSAWSVWSCPASMRRSTACRATVRFAADPL